MAPTQGAAARRDTVLTPASNSLDIRSPRVRHSSSLFPTTKEDKRRMKHSALVSRIEKSTSTAKKRRRPSRKLVTSLENLVETLPEAAPADDNKALEAARARQRKLKSKPGALKRKAKMESLERDRFNKNLAQMVDHRDGTQGARSFSEGQEMREAKTSTRWAALRSFIQQTMPPR